MSGIDLQGLLGTIRGYLPANWLTILLITLATVAFLRSGLFKRLSRMVEEMFFSNWRLGVLAATGLILSAASGWTTWDGMRNFTGEPILSAMVTFGIQGVMLIVAWLIGETFAVGMNQQSANQTDTAFKIAIGLTGLAALLGAAALITHFAATDSTTAATIAWIAAALVIMALFLFSSRVPAFRTYYDGLRVIAQNAVLWVMFLGCMATSVFFSFDSLFSTIFPAEERKRAAELRAQNQVAGIVADVGSLIQRRQLSEAEALFSTKGWLEYDQQLQALARAAQGSQKEIEAYFTNQMEQRRRAVAEQQERIATAQSSQAGLSNKKTSLTDELARLKSERPGLTEDVTQKREVVQGLTKEIDAKRVEVLAEERGVEGTLKQGRGPMYRQRQAEEASLRDRLKIAEERLREPQRRLQQTDQRIVQIERELSALDGDIAKLKGETQTAENRIRLAEENRAVEEGSLKVDPTRMLPAFERARQDFRQSPTSEGLGEIQRQCTQLLGAMTATPATRPKAANVDCEPKTANEAAARVFALNDGIKTFTANCAGGDKLVQYKTADDLFAFARRCAQDSGLASKDTDALRTQINFIELNRDDKANRFVVTWNAFNDGNRLAYLALAIAIAIDSLVFLSGLFGANAVRSPLSDVPNAKARSPEHLQNIIDNALLPARFDNARTVIEALQADTSRPGYAAMVDLSQLDPESSSVVARVLTAGATINAVMRDPTHAKRYFVRPELFEHLSIVGARAFEKDGASIKENISETLKQEQLEKDVSIALLPEVETVSALQINRGIAHGAQTVLDRLRPFPDPEDTGFRSELRLAEMKTAEDERVARRVLTVGSNMRLVQLAAYSQPKKTEGEAIEATDGRYVLHSDFVKTLSRLRARMLLSTSPVSLQLGHDEASPAAPPPRQGGMLNGGRLPMPSDDARIGLPYQPGSPAQSLQSRLDEQMGRAAASGWTQPSPAEPSPPSEPVSRVPLPAADVTPTRALADTDLSRELVEHFGREMGQQSTTIDYLTRHRGAIDVQTLWQSLDRVLRHDENGLRRPMVKAMRNIEQNIDEARASFPSQMLTAPGAAAEVNDFADGLKAMTVVMVMLPGAAYDNLINKMEKELEDDKAAGRLDAARERKHGLLVNHRNELARAEYSEDHWGSVLRSLIKFEHGLAALAGSDQRPPRLA
jgi:predicted  nucleic acid-binding Zn-ribbon protein